MSASLLAISAKVLIWCLLYENLQLGDLRQSKVQSYGNCLTSKELM